MLNPGCSACKSKKKAEQEKKAASVSEAAGKARLKAAKVKAFKAAARLPLLCNKKDTLHITHHIRMALCI